MTVMQTLLKPLCLLLAVAIMAAGCATSPEKKDKKEKDEAMSTLRIHMVLPASMSEFSIRVPVNREPVITVSVDKEPFLSEADVEEARLVEVAGGFDLAIQFNHHGALLLEQYTTANPGQRFAIFSQFGKTAKESRWLAAPTINKRIRGGGITFTPDASRAEVERIVLGLNNVVKKNKERSQW